MRYLSNADIMSLLEKDSELALRLQDYITNNPNYNIRLVSQPPPAKAGGLPRGTESATTASTGS